MFKGCCRLTVRWHHRQEGTIDHSCGVSPLGGFASLSVASQCYDLLGKKRVGVEEYHPAEMAAAATLQVPSGLSTRWKMFKGKLIRKVESS